MTLNDNIYGGDFKAVPEPVALMKYVEVVIHSQLATEVQGQGQPSQGSGCLCMNTNFQSKAAT